MQPDTIKIRASLWYTKADNRLQIQYFNKKHCGPQQRGCNLTPWAKTSRKTRQSGPQKRGSTNITNTIMQPFPRRILQVISWRSPQQWGKLDPLNVGTSQVNDQSETGKVEHNNVATMWNWNSGWQKNVSPATVTVKLKQWLAQERVSCYSHSPQSCEAAHKHVRPSGFINHRQGLHLLPRVNDTRRRRQLDRNQYKPVARKMA